MSCSVDVTLARVGQVAAAVLLTLALLLPSVAKAQTTSCTVGSTTQNCVPVVPFSASGAIGAANPLPITAAAPAAGTAGAGYPPGATAWALQGSGTTAGAGITQPAVAGKFNYLCGFLITPGSATAAITLSYGTSGLVGNISGFIGAPITAAGTTGLEVFRPISPCLPTTAVNGAISVNVSALGTGGVNQTVNAWGYTQ